MSAELCRLCLSEDMADKHYIFVKNGTEFPTSVKIMLCLSLTVTIKDLFPHYICLNCLNTLNNFYDFRERCVLNNRKLINCLSMPITEVNSSLTSCKDDKEQAVTASESVTVATPMDDVNTEEEAETTFYQCTKCNLMFENVDHFKCHECTFVISMNSQINLYQCSFCHKKYKTKSQAKLHEKVHKGTKPHKCGHCEKTFLRPSDKVKHERTHTGDEPFLCQYCSKSFKQVGGLIVHQKHHCKAPSLHPPAVRQENPKLWSKGSQHLTQPLEVQSQEHMVNTLHLKCTDCDKLFVDLTEFNEHEHCPVCYREFNAKGLAAAHVLQMHPSKAHLHLIAAQEYSVSS